MQRRENSIEFLHRRPPQPRLLTGLGLIGLAGVAWWAPVTPLTATVSLSLLTFGVVLVASGCPRWEPIRFDPKSGSLDVRGSVFDPGELSRIELQALAGGPLGRARPSYAAFAVRSDGEREELFEGDSPAPLVRFGRLLAPQVPVLVTWAEGSPLLGDWLKRERPLGLLPEGRVRGDAFARQRKASRMTWAVALGLGITWSYFVLIAPVPPSTFSLGLAMGSFAFMVLTAALVTFNATFLHFHPEHVFVERRVLGVRVKSLRLAREEILRVSPLTPDGEAGHLLFVTRKSAVAVPLAQPTTGRVARRFEQATEPAEAAV